MPGSRSQAHIHYNKAENTNNNRDGDVMPDFFFINPGNNIRHPTSCEYKPALPDSFLFSPEDV